MDPSGAETIVIETRARHRHAEWARLGFYGMPVEVREPTMDVVADVQAVARERGHARSTGGSPHRPGRVSGRVHESRGHVPSQTRQPSSRNLQVRRQTATAADRKVWQIRCITSMSGRPDGGTFRGHRSTCDALGLSSRPTFPEDPPGEVPGWGRADSSCRRDAELNLQSS